MMVMMNCFCGMVDQRKAFSLISNQDHCSPCSLWRISDTTRAGFDPVQNLSSKVVQQCHKIIADNVKCLKVFEKAIEKKLPCRQLFCLFYERVSMGELVFTHRILLTSIKTSSQLDLNTFCKIIKNLSRTLRTVDFLENTFSKFISKVVCPKAVCKIYNYIVQNDSIIDAFLGISKNCNKNL